MNTKVKATTNILFVGNSKTYYNTFPTMFNKLIKTSKTDSVKIKTVTKPWKTLEWNYENQIKGNKSILDTKWDYVVLQEQTAAALEKDGKTIKKGATKIVNALKKKNKNIKVIYNAVWVLKDSPKSDQDKTNNNYKSAKKATTGTISYSGDAFLKAKKEYPNIKLYRDDNRHPTVEGSYLSACCLYATIYKKSPEGIEYYGKITDKDQHFDNWKKNNDSISKNTAKNLQKIAAEVMNVKKKEVNLKVNDAPKLYITASSKKYSDVSIEIKDKDGIKAKNVKFYFVDKSGKKKLLKDGMFTKPKTKKSTELKYVITNKYLNKEEKIFYMTAKDNDGNYLKTYFRISPKDKKYYLIDREPVIHDLTTKKEDILFDVADSVGVKKVEVYDLNNKKKVIVSKKNLKEGKHSITIDSSKLKEVKGKYSIEVYLKDDGKASLSTNRKMTVTVK